jgi:glycosyltransferase involved in cell wall biosynthesis
MKILHLGSGFRPWRRGGLVAYVEDLMEEQVRRGDEVSYLFSGRHYPLLSGPRMRRWERGGVAMLEIINSPLYDHGRQPDLEVSEPRIERMLARVVAEQRPDVVHVQELAGFPSSVLDVIRTSGTPVVVTLQDYFPLCSTFKLIDASGQVCLRRQIGEDCAATIAADPRRPGLLTEATVLHHLRRVAGLHADGLNRGIARAAAHRRPARPAEPGAYQRRRDLNVQRLSTADAVIAMSSRVAEIYEQLGVDATRLRTLQLTLGHIEHLRPRRVAPAGPLTFGTLAALESPAKGAHVLLGAMRLLAGRDDFRVLVHGHVDEDLAREARELPNLELRGWYNPPELDAILDEVDVGLMPSVWEEAYGFAGMEFLAKGIPVIANAIGGMTDYVREGETGWLNRSLTAEELARIMAGVIDDRAEVARLNERLLAEHDAIVKTLARHADEMDEVYREVSAGARARS